MVSIPSDRYEELKNARTTLIHAGAFEYRYEILLGNYLALEQFCSEWSLRSAVEMDHRHERWAKVIVEADRHMMNLLSASRSYADHVVQDFGHLPISPAFEQQAKAKLSAAYDDSLDYRFFAALRNHVQHRATPVHEISHKGKGKAATEGIVVTCYKHKLEQEGGFKSAVLAELGEEVDLREMTRGYMRDLSTVHIELRKIVYPSVQQDRKLHDDAIDEFVKAKPAEELGTPGIGLTIARESTGKFVDVHPIITGWDDVRVILADKNRFPVKF